MTQQNNPLTIEQHQSLGTQIKNIEAQLGQIRKEVGGAYGNSADEQVQNIVKSIEKLKTFLDVRVFIENPGRDGNANAAIYYTCGDKGHAHSCDGDGCEEGCGDPSHNCSGQCSDAH
ncbi:hypothetical protein DENIS_1490 [Desulfonema ishimotonii]|uniref:Uncharacterized protein n=1 Tax=Desulfonema ishimotonii TaxID=45657 RepID=A0A401FU98_9BACT|nr:hypothetical protein [Desulfonema ishimotonii]GBC60533.1 hypothetical protein DENIS_1490 [Desulfonema ishimotonii]